MTNVLLSVAIVLLVLNLIVALFIGRFLVQFRRRVDELFLDFSQVLEELFGTIPTPTVEPVPNREKTWDEKYEEELDAFHRRIRGDSGLQDLSMDQKVSWGVPPAPDPDNSKGLTIQDRTSNI